MPADYLNGERSSLADDIPSTVPPNASVGDAVFAILVLRPHIAGGVSGWLFGIEKSSGCTRGHEFDLGLVVLDQQCFAVSALAFERAAIDAGAAGLDARQHHAGAALRARGALDHFRRRWTKAGLRHNALPLLQAGAQLVSQPPTPMRSAAVGDEAM